MAIGLPLLNAGALFGATTGQSRNSNFVPAVGFGTAGLLAAGRLTESPPRAQIYNAGRAALACAVRQSGPYLVLQSDFDTYLAPSSVFNTRVADVDAQMARVKGAIAGEDSEDLKAYARAVVGQAEAILAKAQTSQSGLAAYRGKLDAAPDRLDETVRQISVEVDRQVQVTLPSLDEIKGQLTAANLSPPAAPRAPAGASTQAQGAIGALNLRAEADTLTGLARELARADQAANAFLLAATAREAETPRADCTVASVTVFAVTPPPSPTVERGQILDIPVQALGGPPKADVSGTDLDKEVLAIATNRYKVRFRTTATTPLGPRTLLITSNDGLQAREIGIDIVAPNAGQPAAAPPAAAPPAAAPPAAIPPAAPPPAAMPPVASAPAAGDPPWLEPETKTVLTHGRRAGEPWRAVAEAYAAQQGVAAWAGAPNAALSTAFRARLDEAVQVAIKSQNLGAGPISAYELWWASAARVEALQVRLGATGAEKTGYFDTRTRELIAARNAGSSGLTPQFLEAQGLRSVP